VCGALLACPLAGTVNRVSEQSGRYSNGELYQLPRSWEAVDEDLLKVAMDRTLRALSIVEGDPKSVEHRLTTYYEPEFEREYVAESRLIADFDAAINASDQRPINPPPEHGG
jgi:hypothetical protein